MRAERDSASHPSAQNRKFESTSLQRTVRVSRDIPLLRRKAGLFPRVCGAEQVARSGETGVARSYRADGRQYLCRAKFQYRSVDEGDGLMRRIGQRQAEHGTLIAPRSDQVKPSSVSCSCQASGRRERTSSLPNINEAVI